ncbi:MULTISPECIES: VOC family protein [Marinomonas]|uniref:VOC family protein n=1 Tax=Marinomonas rhodophyticola TaxID=2992803 RepID=A0ABT3KHP9_9GAMM|nr:VOC family protein [Marinomonas sp. KJ51-3]MCW4630035.1 VOC family protein [Marinomonas sp. KJ51-3]
MIPKITKMRVARPTDNLGKITDMYIHGLGFKLLGRFEGHNGFDGSIIGHEQHNYHLEFTHHKGTTVGKAPTQDNLLIFYVTDAQVWRLCCEKMLSAGFVHVSSYNDYWDVVGKTFEDIDGYRVVLQNREWTA